MTVLTVSNTFDMKYRRTEIAFYLLTTVCYLLSSLPGLSPLYFIYSLGGFFYWTLKKKDENVLLLLLLGSSFSFTSFNIWNNGVVPGLPFWLLGLSLLMTEVRIKIAGAFVTAFCGVCLFVLSIANFFHVGASPILIDLVVIASIPLAALRFRGLSEPQFYKTLSVCSLIALAKIVVFGFAGIENPLLSTYTEARFLDTLDELTGFYLLSAIVLISSPSTLRWVAISLLGVLVFQYAYSDNWLGYYGIGSQVLLVLIIFIFVLLLRSPVGFAIGAVIMLILIPILTMSTDDPGDLKLQQLLAVFDILAGSDITLLPHSVHVRVAEIATFLDSSWWRQLFGGGLGGYVNLSDHFPTYLGPDDYSQQQINSGKITTPHNIGYLLIKFGYAGLAAAFVFLSMIYWIARRMMAVKFAFYITFSAFLILNLGYTLKISFLLGVLWVIFQNGTKMRERLLIGRV